MGTVIFMVAHHIAAAVDPFNWLSIIGALVLVVVFFVPKGLMSVPTVLQPPGREGAMRSVLMVTGLNKAFGGIVVAKDLNVSLPRARAPL